MRSTQMTRMSSRKLARASAIVLGVLMLAVAGGCSTAPKSADRAAFISEARAATGWFEGNVFGLREQVANSGGYVVFPGVGQEPRLSGGTIDPGGNGHPKEDDDSKPWPALLGHEGYRKIHGACYDTAEYLASELEKLGPFEMIYSGDRNEGIPTLCWKMKDDANPGFSLYDLADRLRTRGWQVPAYSMPAHREDLIVQRVLVRHGTSYDMATLLLDDIKRCLEYFKDNPVTKPLPESYGGYKHS